MLSGFHPPPRPNTLNPMENDELRDAYLFAIQKGFTQEAIAKHSRVNVDSLRKFKQGESLGPANRKKLDTWLTDSGLVRGAQNSDPSRVIAKELRTLADVLESGIDVETKRKRLTSLIDAYGSGQALRAAEESSEYGG